MGLKGSLRMFELSGSTFANLSMSGAWEFWLVWPFCPSGDEGLFQESLVMVRYSIFHIYGGQEFSFPLRGESVGFCYASSMWKMVALMGLKDVDAPN